MLAYLLLTLYLPVFPSIAELSKLPLLIEHYLEHKQENADTNALSFLSDHYMVVDDLDGDRNKDDKLPFRSGSAGHITDVAVTAEKKTNITYPGLFVILQARSIPFHYQSGLPSIWQPPRA